MIKLTKNLIGAVGDEELGEKIAEGKGLGERLASDEMAGWVDLPEDYDREELARIKEVSERIRGDSKFLVCIGIGGSYLGARAVIEVLGKSEGVKVLYAGNSLSPREIEKVLAEVGEADFSVNVISKSGTTTEPAIAFRIFQRKLIEKYGEDGAMGRIYATTDANRGALHDMALSKGYERFVVPDNVGGRYSVLTAVGLLPIAVAGVDIDELMAGAGEEREAILEADGGVAVEYAGVRNALLGKGYDIEVLANFEPSFGYFNEWWKQLFGESEGKDGQGIFPASVVYSTDLHSMGQYMQDGRRCLMETVVKFTTDGADIVVPGAEDDADGLGYLEGEKIAYVNEKALEATVEAHVAGGVPVMMLELPGISARTMGTLIYFFEYACAVSGYLLGVNPFDQPGVEEYKQNMFRLLGKPE